MTTNHCEAPEGAGLEPRFWSRQDLADYFQVTTRTIDNWRKKGVLPPPVTRRGKARHRWLAKAILAMAGEIKWEAPDGR